jgi:hypothetical protein
MPEKRKTNKTIRDIARLSAFPFHRFPGIERQSAYQRSYPKKVMEVMGKVGYQPMSLPAGWQNASP